MLTVATWNVNSLRVRLPHVIEWLNTHQPDILALQETKMKDENFPYPQFQALGYHAIYAGQATYNGVALLSRWPADNVITDLPGFADPARRVLGATYQQNLHVLNLYVPNGMAMGSEKYDYKINWLKHLNRYIRDTAKTDYWFILGDFNIALKDEDIHDPEQWHDILLTTPAERKALNTLLELGFCDTFRLFTQSEKSFSWWDYRQRAFQRNLGVRIDLILVNNVLKNHCLSCHIDKTPRGWERPSDHAPVLARFDLS